jgi:hypothetical protein
MENYNCLERLEHYKKILDSGGEINGVDFASVINNCSNYKMKYANCSSCKKQMINVFNEVLTNWRNKDGK